MPITVDVFGSWLLIDGTEIGGFSRIGNADGMTIIMRLDADDTGQKALAAMSPGEEIEVRMMGETIGTVAA